MKITSTYLVGRTNEEFFDFDKIPGAGPRQIETFKPKISITTDFHSITTPQPQASILTPISVPPQNNIQTPRSTQRVEYNKSDMRFCTFCGTAGKKSFHFCQNCGRKFE